MKKNGQATIIILNWNGKKHLDENLDSVLNQGYENFEVLIVDNGSDDNSVDYVKEIQKNHSNVKLLKNEKNLGFAFGNNKGIDRILEEGKSEYIVFLNNDVKVASDWLENLLEGFSDKKIGICTSKIYFYYPYIQVVIVPSSDITLNALKVDDLSYRSLRFEENFEDKGERFEYPQKLKKGEISNFAVPYRSVSKQGNLKVDFEGEGLKVFVGDLKEDLEKSGKVEITLDGKQIIQNAGTDFMEDRMIFEERYIYEFDKELSSEIVDTGCGAAMAVRADLLKQFGGFKEEYFMYYEDNELDFRITREGFVTKFVSDALCYHKFWGSSGERINKLQTYFGTRNRLWFIREYFGFWKFLYFYLRTFARTIVWLVKSPFNSNAKMYAHSYLRVLKDAIKKDYEKE